MEYDQPLQNVVTNTLGCEAVIMEQSQPVSNPVIRRPVSPVPATMEGVNNPGATVFRDAIAPEMKQEPPALVTKRVVDNRKKRGAKQETSES